MILALLLFLLLIIPIAIGFYSDYKSDPQEITPSLRKSAKNIYKGLVLAVLVIGINLLYESVIPFNKSHGIEFNSEREKIGLPTLKEDWKTIGVDQFSTTWWNPDLMSDGHFKKVIIYGFTNVKSEVDYYRSKHKKGAYVWSKYNFEKQTFEYYIENPDNRTTTLLSSAQEQSEDPTKSAKIDKVEFEKYIRE